MKTKLNPFAQRTAERLFVAYPEWRSYAGKNPYNKESLFVEVPAPPHSSGTPLIILAKGGDIIVCYDEHHIHFMTPDSTEEEDFAEAQGFIEGLLREQILIGVKMVGTRSGMSRLVKPGELPGLQPEEITYVRSWKGTYDRKVKRKACSGGDVCSRRNQG